MLVSCRPDSPGPLPAPEKWSLMEPGQASFWQQAGIPGEGVISVQAGELTLPPGQPMTGAKFANWNAAGIPHTNYAISYEAMRLEGGDIFGMCTFPVGSHQSHATFVIGGWGGTVTGISSIEFLVRVKTRRGVNKSLKTIAGTVCGSRCDPTIFAPG